MKVELIRYPSGPSRLITVSAVGVVALLLVLLTIRAHSTHRITHEALPPVPTVAAPPSPVAQETSSQEVPLSTPSPIPAPSPTLSVAELTKADWPASVTLQKPAQIPFKKGSHFVARSGAPLFFLSEYLRDAKPGEQFEILDYNPEKLRVYLLSKDENGNNIALNTLEMHGYSKEVNTVPINTIVALKTITDGKALVVYNGDSFFVPAGDTDLLSQAMLRAQRDSSLTADPPKN